MKKILCLFSALSILLMSSCSSDDSSSDPNDDVNSSVKPSKIIHLTSDNSPIYVREVKYDGNKIISEIDDDGFAIKYTYTGNFITKIEVFDSPTILRYTTEYTYVNGKISIQIVRPPNLTSYIETKYTHNTDGTISYEERQIPSTLEEVVLSSGKYTYKNGNLIKAERKLKDEEDIETTLFEYDTKNNPTKNILGANLIINGAINSSLNNLVKIDNTSYGQTTFSYLYDSNSFPIETKRFGDNGNLEEILQYTY